MKTYNEKCPVCGHINKNLYLEETDGWMECEHCHKDVRVMDYKKGFRLPVFTTKNIIDHMRANGVTI